MKIAGIVLAVLGGLSLLGQVGKLMGSGGDGHQASVSFGGIGFALLMIVGGVILIQKAGGKASK